MSENFNLSEELLKFLNDNNDNKNCFEENDLNKTNRFNNEKVLTTYNNYSSNYSLETSNCSNNLNNTTFFPNKFDSEAPSSSNHDKYALSSDRNFADNFDHSNLIDEFWDSGYNNNDDLEINHSTLAFDQKDFDDENIMNKRLSKRIPEFFFDESSFNKFPEIEFTENSNKFLDLTETSVSKSLKSNTLRDMDTKSWFKTDWRSSFDLDNSMCSNERKDVGENFSVKDNSNFGMPEFDLDTFLSPPKDKFLKENNSVIPMIESDELKDKKRNELLNKLTPSKKSKIRIDEEIDSNNEEDWEDMWENSLPSLLQEPKINQKIMQKIKAKSLIGLRRVKYAVASNSSVEPSKNNSETICFATQPATKICHRKSSKKDSNKGVICKEKSSEKKPREKETLSEKKIVTGQMESHFPPSVPIKSSVNPILPPKEAEFIIKCKVPNSLLNSIQVLGNSSSTSSCKSADQKFPVYQSGLPKLQTKLPIKNANKLNLTHRPIEQKARVGNSKLLNLKNIVKIEIYTKPPKKMVITKDTQRLNSRTSKLTNSPISNKSKPTYGTANLVDILRKNVNDLPDYIMKKLRFPPTAVKRSFFTSLELDCIKRQAQLLRLLKEVKNAPHYCSKFSCNICKDVSVMELELSKLQSWTGGEILNGHSTEVVEQGNQNESLEKRSSLGCKVLQSETNLVKQLIPIGTSDSSKQKGSDEFFVNVEEEEVCDGLTLYISDVGSNPFIQTSRKMSYSPSKILNNSRQWKKAMHYKKLAFSLNENLQSQRKMTPSKDCLCQDNCRSFLTCACASQVSICVDCACATCENPFYAFEVFGVSLQSVKADPCLLQTVYDVGLNELLKLLNKDCTLPCCSRSLKLYQIIPNVVECLHCGSYLSYSWCQMAVRDEKLSQRNHCAICGNCQRPLFTHCYVCETCTLSCAAGKCLICREEKVFAGIALE